MYYKVYRLSQSKTNNTPVELAKVVGTQVIGPEATLAKQYLLDGGWPKRPPHHALHGSVIWATLPILEDKDIPEEGWIQNVHYLWERDILSGAV